MPQTFSIMAKKSAQNFGFGKTFFFWFERPPQNRILGASLSNCDIEDLLYFHVDFCISTTNKTMQTFTKLKLLKQKTTNLK